jgi:hypothetical protein
MPMGFLDLTALRRPSTGGGFGGRLLDPFCKWDWARLPLAIHSRMARLVGRGKTSQ